MDIIKMKRDWNQLSINVLTKWLQGKIRIPQLCTVNDSEHVQCADETPEAPCVIRCGKCEIYYGMQKDKGYFNV